LHLNKFARLLYPSFFVWQIPSKDNDVYLTFDDGPVPDITEYVLEVLDKYNIKASFFCVGENVLKNAHIFNTIIQKGHVVGNHTFNHLNGWKTTKKMYLENVEQCQKIIDSHLFRPPYGRISYAQANVLKDKYKIIMWSVLTYDFDKSIPPEKCLTQSIKRIKKGDIIVFHDNIKAEKNMKFGLPRLLEHLLENGYRFKTL